jgi:hypothetical protein
VEQNVIFNVLRKIEALKQTKSASKIRSATLLPARKSHTGFTPPAEITIQK